MPEEVVHGMLLYEFEPSGEILNAPEIQMNILYSDVFVVGALYNIHDTSLVRITVTQVTDFQTLTSPTVNGRRRSGI
jgi:hypothetical protein